MKHALLISVFTVLVTLFYWYVSQQVPQKETYPPETLEIRADLTTDEMVEIGREIMAGKGTCLTCHTIGSDKAERFPDLAGIGAGAAKRKEGQSDIEYLAESMYDPNVYIVEGFVAGMPPINKPPTSLTDEEILTVLAYLQSLGGTPTVTMQTTHKFTGQGASLSAAAAAPASSRLVAQDLDGETLFTTYSCNTCHNTTTSAPLVGPSLYDVGNRLTPAELYESILEPNATITKGFPQDVMLVFLQGMNFYDNVSSSQLKVLVDYLASMEGN
jgi:mono/diheme cytochrome c family protein